MARSRTLGIVLAVLAVPTAALVWWLGSPLFLDRTVDEELPYAVGATIPDTMTRGQVNAAMAAAAAEVDEVAEPMPGDEAPRVIRRGRFTDADDFHRGSGQAIVYRLAGGNHLLRFEQFRVTNGPDLRVLLTSHAAPANRDDLDAAGYVELGRLKGNVGNQNYAIPADVALADQQSVVIYCRPFHVVFSVARLAEAQE